MRRGLVVGAPHLALPLWIPAFAGMTRVEGRERRVREVGSGGDPARAGRAIRESPLRGLGESGMRRGLVVGLPHPGPAPLDSCLRRNDATMEERCEIARVRSQGSSVRQIGRCGSPAIDGGSGAEAQRFPHVGYQPRYANQQAGCGVPAGAGRSAAGQVLAGLGAGWSRRRWQGVSRWTRGGDRSPESMYRFIYAQMAQRHYLPRAKAKRGFRGGAAAALPPTSPSGSPSASAPMCRDRATSLGPDALRQPRPRPLGPR